MKYIYTLITIFSFGIFAFAQVPTVDFETNGADYIASTDANGSVSIIDDDSTNGTKVAELSTPAADYHAFEITLDNKLSFSDAAAKIISFDFYQADATAREILVKVDAGTGDAHAAFEVQQTTAASAGWQNLSFDFSSARGSYPNGGTTGANLVGTYTKMFIFIDFGSSIASTTRIDNIGGGTNGGSNVVATPQDSAATPTNAQADVISVFSDHYTSGVANFNLNAFSGGTSISEKEFVSGDKVIEISGLDYVGQGFDAVDVSGMTHIHFDYWIETSGGAVDFYLISAGAENAKTVSLSTASTWTGVDIALTDYTVPDLSQIFQFKWDGQTNSPGGTLYIDNIYFWAPPAENTDINFTVDATNNSHHPNPANVANDESFAISYSTDGGSTYTTSDVLTDANADGIWEGTLTLAKSLNEVKYKLITVDVTSGYGTAIASTGDALAANADFTVALGANSVAQNLFLLDREASAAAGWATLSSSAVVTVTFMVRSETGIHPQTKVSQAANQVNGSTYQLGVRAPGQSCYGIAALKDEAGTETAPNVALDKIWSGTKEVAFYSDLVYEVYAHGPPGWCQDDTGTKDANTNAAFTVSVVEDDVTEDLTALASLDSNNNWLVYTSSLSVDDLGMQNQLVLYPNPTDGMVHISGIDKVDSIKAFTIGGQLIKEAINTNALDLSSERSGLYMIEIQHKGATSVNKLIIR